MATSTNGTSLENNLLTFIYFVNAHVFLMPEMYVINTHTHTSTQGTVLKGADSNATWSSTKLQLLSLCQAQSEEQREWIIDQF